LQRKGEGGEREKKKEGGQIDRGYIRLPVKKKADPFGPVKRKREKKEGEGGLLDAISNG